MSTRELKLEINDGDGSSKPLLRNGMFGDDEPESQSKTTKSHFTMWGIIPINYSLLVVILCVATVAGGTGQSVFLPFLLSTLAGNLSPYFVLSFCGISFTIFFSLSTFVMYLTGAVKASDLRRLLAPKYQLYMMLVGLFDALNGILVVFDANPRRTPPALQSILTQMIMPFTVIFSFILLRKRYGFLQMTGVGIVLVGMIFSLIPLFIRMGNGTVSTQVDDWYYPLLFAVGMLPAALMNIVQEKLQIKWREDTGGRLSIFAFQAVESGYQSLSFILLAWVNIIPNFGSETNVSDAFTEFGESWKCFFDPYSVAGQDRCQYSGAFGIAFISSYILSYIAGTAMTEYTSANLSSLVTTTPTMLATTFWFVWPAANRWAGGAALTGLDAGFNLGALPFIGVGVVLYRIFEVDKHKKLPADDEGTIELCWPIGKNNNNGCRESDTDSDDDLPKRILGYTQ